MNAEERRDKIIIMITELGRNYFLQHPDYIPDLNLVFDIIKESYPRRRK